MNNLQVMGIIAICTAVFLGVVALLSMQGVHILLSVLGVYLFAVWTMLCMQRKARDIFDGKKFRSYLESHRDAARASDFSYTGNVHYLYQD